MSDLTEMIQESLRPLRAAYYSAVRDIAEEALSEYPDDEDARAEFMCQSVDGSEWVIYTYKARLVAVLTDNVNAHEASYGAAPDKSEWTEPSPEKLAYEAMMIDVQEAAQAMIDFPEPSHDHAET